MKLSPQSVFLTLILVGGVALAEGAVDPDVKARQDMMAANGAAMKTLGGMASAKIAFDATAAEAERAGADLVLKQEVNAGKGSAVRAGMLAATGRVVAFTDADLSYAPDQLLLLLDGVEQGWDVVVGSRQHVETQTVVRAGRIREVGGRIINVLTGLVLLGRYRDTQCGLKAMRADVGRLIFSHARIDGFAFDVEVFALVERYRLTLHEVPVEVQNSERSTVNVARDAFRLIRDLFRIRRWGRLGQYEIDPAEFPQAGSQA